MSIDFHNTVMGRAFFEGTMPNLVQQLKKLNDTLAKLMPEKRCPSDGSALVFIGDIGIVDGDGRWDAETTRYRCEKGHMVFIADAVPIHEAEEDAAK